MDKLYSHKDKLLYTHLLNVSNKMLDTFNNQFLDLKVFNEENLRKIIHLVGICHDFGKSMKFFQDKLKGKKTRLSNHALISAFFCLCLIDEMDIDNKELYQYISFIIIRRHHGSINAPNKIEIRQTIDLEKQLNNILENNKEEVISIYSKLISNNINIENILKIMKNNFKRKVKKLNRSTLRFLKKLSSEDIIEVFLVINYIFSLLVSSDKTDAAGIKDDVFNDEIKILDVKGYIDDNFIFEKEIDFKRNEFLNEILDSNIYENEYLYTITAPTGIGKTLSSFALINRIKKDFKVNKMVYCLPYTSIIDQNYDVFENVFNHSFNNENKDISYEYLIKHHYLTFFESKDREGNLKTQSLDYLNNKLFLESWESQNVVTTFVQFLESIITNNNSRLKKFKNMVNSIIVLDEIQAVPVKYYNLIGKVLEVFAKRFKTYIVLMTATQPNIIPNTNKLIDEKKFYFDKLFNRCILDTRGLDEEITVDELINEFDDFNKNNALIVVNTIKASLDVYNGLDEKLKGKYIVKYLSTNLTPFDRLRKISEINDLLDGNEKVILVTTQLIEAGVDLSFEVVFRDSAPLDSIIQVAGRCNRSSELDYLGEVKLINLLNQNNIPCAKKIYDIKLLDITKNVLKKDKYENIDFYELSEKYFSKIKKLSISKSNSIIDSMKSLNYDNTNKDICIEDFKLIEETYYDTRVVICQSKEIENKIYEMADLKEEIKNQKKYGYNSDLYRKFDKLKKEIDKYTIDIYNYQLDYYRDESQNLVSYISSLNIVYFSYNDQNDYIYDKEVGFLEEPKREIQSSLFL